LYYITNIFRTNSIHNIFLCVNVLYIIAVLLNFEITQIYYSKISSRIVIPNFYIEFAGKVFQLHIFALRGVLQEPTNHVS